MKRAFHWIIHYIATKAHYVRQTNRDVKKKTPGVLPVGSEDEDKCEDSCGQNEEVVNLQSSHWGLDTPITIEGPVFYRQRLPTVCEDEPCCHTPPEFTPPYNQAVDSGMSQTEHHSLLWDILNASPEGLKTGSPVPGSSESHEGDSPVGQRDICQVVERALMLVGNLPAAKEKAKIKLA